MMDLIEKWKGLLASSFEQFLNTLGSYMPSIIGAIALLITGFVVAWLCRWLILRLANSLDIFAQRYSVNNSVVQFKWSLTRLLANIVYFLVLLFFVTATAESLGLPGIAEWLGHVIVYLPSLVIAMFIVWFGFLLGTFVRDKVSSLANTSNITHADELGAIARISVIALTIVIGLSQIGIHIQLIEQLLVVITTAIVIALGLAFGLGASPTMANIVSIGNLKQRYNIGDRIKIDSTEGEIISFSKTAVIIDTGPEQASIPARLFQEKASFLIMQKNDDSDT